MAESSFVGTSAPNQAQARTSGRNKVKSQRAMDSEDTARMFAAVKARQKADAEAIARGEQPATPVVDHSKVKSRSSKAKGKGRASKEELYCLCKKPSGDDDGPMIECAECNDWFHFSCIELSEEEAEKIHDYICRDCNEATGKKTTMINNIATYKSPSPLVGESIAAKRKPKTRSTGSVKPRRSNSPPSGDGEGDESGSGTSSDSGSDAEQEILKLRAIKRQRSSRDDSRKPSVDTKPVTTRPAPTSRKTSVVLPKARIFVLDKLAELVKGIFGDKLDEEGVHRYAKNVEDSLFEAFKDGTGPKAVAGGRYKTQFTLLDRSLPKARPELLEEITSFKIDAAKLALLNSADLASAERLEELEKAKRAMLEQTVKQRVDQGSIRLGRDGFEQVEDFRERDMGVLARQEQAARKEAERRESLNAESPDSPTVPESPFAGGGRRESASATPQLERVQSNTNTMPQSPVAKRESVDIRPAKSPIKSNFGLVSAWSGGADDAEHQSLSLGDQSALDLSDIVAEPELDTVMDIDDGLSVKEVMEVVETPVVWTGGIFNPAVDSSKPVKMEARIAAKTSFMPQWNILLPHDPVAITGRVPVNASLAYLSESRLNPSRELVTVVFSPEVSASAEDTKAWNELIEFHIAKDRHAIYHPYAEKPDRPKPDRPERPIPNNAAKELYLIPLRPADPMPEFTDLLQGFSVSTTRTTSILLGVFIGDKRQLHYAPQHPVPAPIPSIPTPPSAAAPALPNARLQELMASLNPAALHGVLSGSKSPNPPIPQPPQQAYQQYPPYGQTQGSGGQYPPQGYYPPATNDYNGYNQYPTQGYQGNSPHDRQYGQGGNTPDWQSMPPPQNRDRQQGWDQRRDRRY